MEGDKKRPVHKERTGNGVAVAVFENTGRDDTTYHTAQLTKSYRDKDGELKEQRMTLRVADLLLVATAANRTFAWCADNHPAAKPQDEEVL